MRKKNKVNEEKTYIFAHYVCKDLSAGGGLKALADMSTRNLSFFGTALLIANTYNINRYILFDYS